MAEIKKYLDTVALGTLVDQIKAEDAKALAAAKKYADDLGKTYDAAGAATTAESNAKAYTDELANGAVKTNTEAIAKLNGDASTEGSVAKAIAEAKADLQGKIDAVDAIADQNAADIDTLEGKVAALEAGTYDDTEVRGLISANADAISDLEKTHGEDKKALEEAIALKANQSDLEGVSAVANAAVKQTDYDTKVAALEAEDARIAGLVSAEADRAALAESGLETRLKAVEDDYLKGADKTELSNAIDDVAGDVADIAADYLKAADKTELSDAIALKADQTALDAEVQRATQAESNLQTQINTIMNNPDAEGAINSINEFTKYVADHGSIADGFRTDIDKNKDDIAAMDTAYKAADTAMQGRLDKLEAIDHEAYVAADTALKNELNVEIGKKAAQADLEAMGTRVGNLETAAQSYALKTEVEAVQDNLDAYTAAHAEDYTNAKIDELIQAVADDVAELGDTYATDEELTQAIEAAKTDASNKDAVVLAEAQKASAAVQTNLDTHTGNTDIHVTAEQKTAWTTAAGKAHEHANKDVLDGITSAKVTAWDGAEQAAKTYADGLNTAMTTKVDGIDGRVKALEEAAPDYALDADLDAAIERIAANEIAIAANTSAINSFVAITSEEVAGLFA